MRRRIYELIEVSHDNDDASYVYDAFMLMVIIVSVMPLAYKEPPAFFQYTDIATTVIFIIDYLLRLWTADLKIKKSYPYLRYPFTPMAIVDLLSILPTLTELSSGFRLFRLFRIYRTFRIFRIFKAFRYSRSINILNKVVKESKDSLMAVVALAVGYILISALVIFNVESNTFDTFLTAVYWSAISLTTVGYGDIYPVTNAGRVVTIISSILGIAIVALPSSIITAGYMKVVKMENPDTFLLQDDDDIINKDEEEIKEEEIKATVTETEVTQNT